MCQQLHGCWLKMEFLLEFKKDLEVHLPIIDLMV